MQIRFLPGRGGAWISESNLLGILPTVVQSWWVYTSWYPASLTTACDPNLANWTVSPMALNLLGQEKGFFFFLFNEFKQINSSGRPSSSSHYGVPWSYFLFPSLSLPAFPLVMGAPLESSSK